MKACVVYPLDSAPTSVTAIAGDRVAALLEEAGFTVFRFDTWKAARLILQLQQLVNPSPLVVYLGHGDADRLFGQLPVGLVSPLVDLLNAGVLRDKIVVTIACRTGLELGPRSPARVYLGSRSWMYVAFPSEEHNYMEDYIDTWVQIPRALAEGKTAGEAYAAYADRVVRYLSLYDGHPEWPNGVVYRKNLYENLAYYGLWGNPSAKLE